MVDSDERKGVGHTLKAHKSALTVWRLLVEEGPVLKGKGVGHSPHGDKTCPCCGEETSRGQCSYFTLKINIYE